MDIQTENSIYKLLENKNTLIIDGGFGTEIQEKGANITDDELWSARCLESCPELVIQVHQDYILAGADIIICASYKASIQDFLKYGYSETKAIQLIKNSVELAKKARSQTWQQISQNQNNTKKNYPLIAASISSYGAFLYGQEYTGNFNGASDDFLKDFHRKQLQILAGEGPDLLAMETIPSIQEVRVLLELIQEPTYQKLNVPVWIAVSCKDGQHLGSGESIEQLTEMINQMKNNKLLVAIGVNCSHPQYCEQIVSEFKKGTDLPILVYANSGETYDAINKIWIQTEGQIKDKHQQYVEFAQSWVKKGARLIGGCCRTSPETIQALRNYFDQNK